MSSNIGGINGTSSSSGVTAPKSGTEELKKKQEEQQVLGQQKSSQSAADMWDNLESTATQQSQNIQDGQQTKEGQAAQQGQDVQQEQNTQQKQQAQQGQGVQQEQNTQQKQQAEAKDGKVYAQNGETFDKTAERLGFKKGTEEYENFKKANSEAAEKGWFYLHKEVSVPDDLKSKLTDGAYNTDTNAEQAKWKAWVDGGKKPITSSSQSSSANISEDKQTVTDNSANEQTTLTTQPEETSEKQAVQSQRQQVQQTTTHQTQTPQSDKLTATQQGQKPTQSADTKKADNNKQNPTSPQVAHSNEQTNGIGDIDGKFNDYIAQSRETGDCYLIGAMDSVLAKPNGRKALENNINVNKQNNTAQVKYGNKNYNVDLTTAKNREDLESVGGDARLLELAEEQQRLNSGHKSTSPTDKGDILYDGKALNAYKNMGLKDVKEEPVPGKFDYNKFNDPNKAYAYRRGDIPGRTGAPMGTSKADGQVPLKSYHQYAILGATKDAVLFHNPYKPFDPNNPIGEHTIYVPKSELEKYPYWLDSGSFA